MTNSYDAKDIKQLDQRTHARHRVGMYLGGNSDDGLTTALREISDNSIDEVLGGHGNDVIVTFHKDGSAEVADHGRGLPVDKDSHGKNGIILTLGSIGSGGKFNAENYKLSGGMNGVGASVAVATSARADITVYRDGKKHQLSFKEGLPGFFAKDDDPFSLFTSDTELRVTVDDRSVTERKKYPTGTTIRFWPDFTVFAEGSVFLVDELKFRYRSTAFLVPGLSITVVDARQDEGHPVIETYHFDGGLSDMLPTLTSHAFVTSPVHLSTSGSFTETRNIIQEDGSTKRAEVERNVDIDVAFAYANVEENVLKSYVNIINTKNGGTHESGMWRALSRVLVNYVKSTKGLLKAKEEPPTLEDVRDGFVGVISIKFPEPTFTGQEKSTLATQQITALISQTVGAELQNWLDDKKNARAAKALAQKIVDASRIRLAARQQKDVARRKTALQGASMPAKLVDCSESDSVNTELHIVEGDSALGSMRPARDSRYQALIPIRGKIINAQKATLKQVLDNAEAAALIQIIGAGSGKTFDIDMMRYGRIIITADADADGAHIRSLLIVLFWKQMRPLVEAGRLYSAVPPLFGLKTLGKNSETIYVIDEEELQKTMARLDKQGKKYGPANRFKGLGEMDSHELWDTTLDPTKRVLRQITVKDAVDAEAMLELAMGSSVGPRKDWIVANSALLSDEDIDIR